MLQNFLIKASEFLIWCSNFLVKKNSNLLKPVKDNLGLKVTGVYSVPCECGMVYVGQIDRTIKARCREHMRHICLGQPEKSAVAD
jgi:hypothetical protein